MASPLDIYRRAIQGIESSGDYGIVGPTHPQYGRALGAYQVMEANLPKWTKDAIGREVSADEFLSSKDIQDRVFDHRFGGDMAQNGGDPRQAASVWFTGRPINAQSSAAKDSLGTSGSRYLAKFDQAVAKAQAGDGAASAPDGAQVAQADLPAPDAAETAGPAPQSGFDAFMVGGPGALFGKPQEGWNAGDALLGVGTALMARDNPKGAAALSALATYKKADKAAKSALRIDPKTGQAAVFDPNTGAVSTQQVFPREPDDPKEPTRKAFQGNSDIANIHAGMADKFGEYRGLLAEGKLDLSILDRVKKSYAELADTPMTEAQRNAVRFALDMEKMRNDKLLEAKGIQTEGDAQRAMNAILPGMGRYNRDAVLEAMDAGYASAVKGYKQSILNNDAAYRKNGDRLAYTGYDDSVKARQKGFDDAETAFAPKRDEYRKRRADEAAKSSESLTGRQDKSQPSGSGLSLYERWKQKQGGK